MSNPAVSRCANVFVADSSRLSCQLITAALRRGRYRARVAGYATDGAGILEGLEHNEVDIAVIAVRLKEGPLAGLKVTKGIRTGSNRPSVIMILDSMEPSVVVEAFRAGASGVFSRDESFRLLCKCIHA